MVGMMDVVYDRPVLRTVRTATILFMVEFLLMLLPITHETVVNPAVSAVKMIPVYVYLVLVTVLTTRLISDLRELEKENPTPTKAMEKLFSVAMYLPVCFGIIPIGLVLRYIRLLSGS